MTILNHKTMCVLSMKCIYSAEWCSLAYFIRWLRLVTHWSRIGRAALRVITNSCSQCRASSKRVLVLVGPGQYRAVSTDHLRMEIRAWLALPPDPSLMRTASDAPPWWIVCCRPTATWLDINRFDVAMDTWYCDLVSNVSLRLFIPFTDTQWQFQSLDYHLYLNGTSNQSADVVACLLWILPRYLSSVCVLWWPILALTVRFVKNNVSDS